MSSLTLILATVFIGAVLGTWLVITTSIRLWKDYRENFTARAQENLHTMFMFVDARRVFAFNAVAIVVVPLVVYLLTGRIFYAVVMGIIVLSMPKLTYRYLQKRRLAQFDQQLPDGLTMISGAMRAGASMPMAIEGMVRETEGPVSQEFSLVLREQRMGVSLDEAFENLGDRVDSQDLTLVVAAARIARDVGGNLSEIFDRLANTLRQKAVMAGKIKSLTSQGIMQGWVVGLLPIGIMAVLYQMEPDAMRPLFTSIGGWATLTVIGLMELMGGFMIKKIVTIDI